MPELVAEVPCQRRLVMSGLQILDYVVQVAMFTLIADDDGHTEEEDANIGEIYESMRGTPWDHFDVSLFLYTPYNDEDKVKIQRT